MKVFLPACLPLYPISQLYTRMHNVAGGKGRVAVRGRNQGPLWELQSTVGAEHSMQR